jgi:hypothetical protein
MEVGREVLDFASCIRLRAFDKGPRGETVKAFDSVVRGIEYFEQPIDTSEFKNHRNLRRNGGELEVSVSFHGFFHGEQQEFNAGAIQLPHVGKVEHEAWPINTSQGYNFPA